ncbi:MAG: hypothetical protein EB078_02295 [Proteobacteria bacterium]|nr:hypothetical protein [Pseudomonadota bacterium]NDC23579.1 hypothetical protein [Pseudomonadota bacterium]NDD03712.1 hypothetical protein [Pseudomonadota bacterium]NDG26849.1 hypothetical protein [Pseudomonadota bacterium]
MVPEKSPQSAKKKTVKAPVAKAAPKTKEKKVEEPVATTPPHSEMDPAKETRHDREMESAEERVSIAPRSPQDGVARPEPKVQDQRPVAPFREGDDYSFMVRYDKGLRIFVGSVAEIPECKSSGMSREEVLKDLKIKLEDFIEDHRVQGHLPEPIFSKQYPEKLSVTVSQSVYRKLDLLSRMEKVALDHLVVELLASAADRRLESGKGGQKHAQPNSGQQPRHQHHGNRHGGGHGRNRHSQGNLDSRENFMEYVRNLEKGGNRWKK